MVQMKPFHYLYVIIGMLVAAFFGISLGMGITCMIPVSFVVIGLFAYQNMKKNLPVGQAILNGGLPPLIGGLLIWLCFLLGNWFNVGGCRSVWSLLLMTLI